jgi:hypothetical protein
MANIRHDEKRQKALMTSAPLLRHSYACGERTGVGGRKWPDPSRHTNMFQFAWDQPFYPNFSRIATGFQPAQPLQPRLSRPFAWQSPAGESDRFQPQSQKIAFTPRT